MTETEPVDRRAPEESGLPEAVHDPEAARDPEAEMAVAEAGAPRAEFEVGLVRSVRYGRILVGGTAIGAVVAGIAALFFSVAPDATYELGQAVGLAAVIGAVVGITLGAALSLVLGVVAKRSQGAALAMHTDVR